MFVSIFVKGVHFFEFEEFGGGEGLDAGAGDGEKLAPLGRTVNLFFHSA